jgi:hypothetical protein
VLERWKPRVRRHYPESCLLGWTYVNGFGDDMLGSISGFFILHLGPWFLEWEIRP